MNQSLNVDLRKKKDMSHFGQQRRTTFKIDLEDLKLDKFKKIMPVKNAQS